MPARYDRNAPIKKPVRHDAGYLRAEAHFARTGIQEYRGPDGKVRRELRLPEEVFHKDALESFAQVPVTNLHPPEMLTATNAQKYTVGTTGESVRPDGSLVLGSVAVHDAATIKGVEAGSRSEASCGYTCDLDETPGTWNGQSYDAIQRNIRGNHVALVPKGRAGPEARIHLDAADAVEVDAEEKQDATSPGAKPHNDGAGPMEKVLINGIWVEVPSVAAQALAAERKRTDAATQEAETSLKAAQAEAQKEKGRADQLKSELEKVETARKDAADPAKLNQLIKARVALVKQASAVLPKTQATKLDGMTDAEVKMAVLKHLSPSKKFDGKDEGYIEGAFEVAIEAALASREDRAPDEDDELDDERADSDEDEDGEEEAPRRSSRRKDGLDTLRRTMRNDEESRGDADTNDEDKARQKYLKRMDSLGKKLPVGAVSASK